MCGHVYTCCGPVFLVLGFEEMFAGGQAAARRSGERFHTVRAEPVRHMPEPCLGGRRHGRQFADRGGQRIAAAAGAKQGRRLNMDILYLLIPLSLVLVLLIGVALWWSTDHDQFDNLEAEGRRILDEDGGSGGP